MAGSAQMVEYNLRPTQELSIFYFCDHFSQTDKKTRKGIYQHSLWQASTLKEHAIVYERTKTEDKFFNFTTTHKNLLIW